jgi:hypothetical protein
MPDENQKTTLRKIELGVLVTIALAIIGFAFWLGGLQSKVEELKGKVDKVDSDKLRAMFDGKVSEAISKTTVPKGTIIAWFASSGPVPEGWRICDGTPGSGTPNLTGRFLRGVTNFGQVGQTGGSESHHHADVRKNGINDGNGWQKDGQNQLGRTDEQNHLPPYVQVIYIIKL